MVGALESPERFTMTPEEARTRFEQGCQEVWEAYRQDCRTRGPKPAKRRAVGNKACSWCHSARHAHVTGGNLMSGPQAGVYLTKMAPLHTAHAVRMEAIRIRLVADLGAPDYPAALQQSRYWETSSR